MNSKNIFPILAFILCLLFPAAAEAKRGIRIPFIGGIGGESLVKVLDLPNTPVLKLKGGGYIDLGYKFDRFSGGEWVGYVGSSSRYKKLNESQLKMLLRIAGVSELPPVPERSFFGSAITWLLLIVGVGIIGMRVLGFFARRKKPQQQTVMQNDVASDHNQESHPVMPEVDQDFAALAGFKSVEEPEFASSAQPVVDNAPAGSVAAPSGNQYGLSADSYDRPKEDRVGAAIEVALKEREIANARAAAPDFPSNVLASDQAPAGFGRR